MGVLTEFESAFSAMANERADAIVIQEDAVFVSNTKKIVDLAAKQRLALAGNVELAEAGGLIGYGPDFLAMCRRAAVFVSAILKGGRPAGLPVEQAVKFTFVIPHRASGLLNAVGRRREFMALRSCRMTAQGSCAEQQRAWVLFHPSTTR